MGQIKNIKLHIVTDIKVHVDTINFIVRQVNHNGVSWWF